MNLSAQFKDFLLAQPHPPTSVTIKNYISDINKFSRWYKNTLNRDFNPQDINQALLNSFKKDSLMKYSASSVDRSISSLRKFFYFLKLEGHISHSPFEITGVKAREGHDPWRLKDFKNHLYVFNASHLTIKNYIIDVKQFLTWAQLTQANQNSWEVSDKNVFSSLSSELIGEYKKRLLIVAKLSPVSVNRKLSSIRRYISWAKDEGLIEKQPIVTNLQAQTSHLLEQAQDLRADQGYREQGARIYSSFPPLRLAQKTKNSLIALFDSLFIYPLSNVLEASEQILWQARGRPVFKEGLTPNFKIPSFKIFSPTYSGN